MKNWSISNRINYKRAFKIISSTLFVALFTATSCSDDDGDSISGVDKPACTITKETNTTTGKQGALTYTLVSEISHTYDAAGNAITESYANDYTYSDGKKSHSYNNANMQYDSKGFLLRTLRQYGGTDAAGKSTSSNQNDDYTYEKERLIKDATQWIDNGTDRSYVTTYEYNDGGKIVKTQNTYNNSATTFQYDGDAVAKITYSPAGGKDRSPFIQYDANGRVVKTIDTSNGVPDEYRYEYTSEGQLAREERYYDSKPTYGATYEYDTKQSPYIFLATKYKGFPTVPSTRPDYTQKHNFTKITTLTGNDTQTALVANTSTIYIYDYNTKGLPSGVSYKMLDNKGIETSSTVGKYEYSDCQ